MSVLPSLGRVFLSGSVSSVLPVAAASTSSSSMSVVPNLAEHLKDTWAGWLLMGKGDPKTKKGKMVRKSNGNTRTTPKKLRKKKESEAPTYPPPLPDEFLEPFAKSS